MNKTQLQATRSIHGIVRDMLRQDPRCKAAAQIDAAGMAVTWVNADGEDCQRAYFFNAGGWSANQHNAKRLRWWCGV